MKKIERLTKEQELLIPIVRQEWLDRLFKYQPLNRDACSRGIYWMYELAKLKKPLVVFLDSPAALQMGANIINRAQVGAQVGAQVWDQMGDQVRAQVRDQVETQVRDQVRAQVRDQVRAQVWDQVGDQVGAQVRAQVWDQVGAQVRDQKLKFYYFTYYGSAWDFGWTAFYDYFGRIGVQLTCPNWPKWKSLITSGVYDMIQLDGVCFACGMPNFISRDNNNRLHNEHRSAVSWADGYEQHYLWEVFFPKELFIQVTQRTLNFKQIMQLQNIEQRMVAIKLMEPDKLLKGANATLLDKSQRKNDLYLIKEIYNQDAYFLRYKCPSTGRVYLSGVDPEIGKKKDADACMAWKFKIPAELYQELNLEG